jgi:hypothetical protein
VRDLKNVLIVEAGIISPKQVNSILKGFRMKTLLKCTLSATVVSMITNSVYYFVTAEMNHLAITRPMPLMGMMIANHVVFALLMSYIYPRYKRSESLSEGATYGVLMGAVSFIPSGLVVRSAWDVPAGLPFVANIICALVTGALMGLVIARLQRSSQ